MPQNKGPEQYQPLNAVRKKLRIKWYRSPIDKEILRELTLKSDFKGWVQASGHLAVFLLTGIITYFF